MLVPTAGVPRSRDLLFFATPRLWPTWPFLPVVRRSPGEELECGVLYDALGVSGLGGYRATVFFTNIYLLPQTEDAFLALPHETFDTPEELAARGWTVD